MTHRTEWPEEYCGVRPCAMATCSSSGSSTAWAATSLTSSAPCRTWRNADDLVEFVRLGGGEVIGDERTHQGLASNPAAPAGGHEGGK